MLYRSIRCISEDSPMFLQATKRLAAVSCSPVPYMLGAGRIEDLVTGKPGRACFGAWCMGGVCGGGVDDEIGGWITTHAPTHARPGLPVTKSPIRNIIYLNISIMLNKILIR